MSAIRFETKLYNIGSLTILRLPQNASAKLPSRGMVMTEGTINGFRFQAELEPDGRGSHWLKVDEAMSKNAHIDAEDIVILAIEPVKKWPEPKIPEDLKIALAAAPQIYTLWMGITPIARWDWIRWIGSTKNPQTRKIRIEKTLSKLKSGKRAACCFNRSQCTVPEVSKNGVLFASA